MKKLPVALATLTLAAGSANLVTMDKLSAMEDWEEEPKNGPAIAANVYDERVRFTRLNAKKMALAYEINYSDAEGRKPVRAILAAYEYSNKQREATADEWSQGLDLSTIEDRNLVYQGWVYEDFGELVDGKTSGVMEFTDFDLTEMNKADFLYYAVEFAAEGQESVWVRGKFDYRKCVHASDFTGECKVVTGVESYEVIPAEHEGEFTEVVMGWEEERMEMVRPYLRAIEPLIAKEEAGWRKGNRLTLGALFSLHSMMLAVEDVVLKYNVSDEMASEMNALRSRLNTIWLDPVGVTEEPAGDSDDTSEGGDSEVGSTEGGSGGAEGEGTGAPAGAESVGSGSMLTENAGTGGDNAEGTTMDGSVSNSEAFLGQPESGVGLDGAMDLAAQVSNSEGVQDGFEGVDEVDEMETDEDLAEEMPEIGVPSLGGEEKKSFWWVWILVVTGAVGAGWWVKRAFFGRKTEKN